MMTAYDLWLEKSLQHGGSFGFQEAKASDSREFIYRILELGLIDSLAGEDVVAVV